MTARNILRGFAAFVSAIVLSNASHAQVFRAYLAVGGSDANPCTLQQPCRLLPAALGAVASVGEIWMLDYSGGGLLASAGNNAVRNNGTDAAGTITAVATM